MLTFRGHVPTTTRSHVMNPELPLHPIIVHTPIALLMFSALFALVGRLMDRDWVRKAAMLMLVIGFLGAIAANLSGNAAEELVEEHQGVPAAPLEDHETAGRWVMFVSGAAVLAYGASQLARGGARSALGVVGLVLQLMAAAAVVRAGALGGELVYHHAAGVSVNGQPVPSGAGAGHGGDAR